MTEDQLEALQMQELKLRKAAEQASLKLFACSEPEASIAKELLDDALDQYTESAEDAGNMTSGPPIGDPYPCTCEHGHVIGNPDCIAARQAASKMAAALDSNRT